MENLFANYQQMFSNIYSAIEAESNDADTLEATSLPLAEDLTESLKTEPQSEFQGTLFVPFLGQSNAEHMSIVYAPYQPGSTVNETSGAIVLGQSLGSLTGINIVTNSTQDTNFAVGGSKVNGNGYYMEDSRVWWYPDENRPGGALLEAEQGLEQWFIDNGAQPTDEIAIVWSQGESDVGDIFPNDPATKEGYKQSTIAVFNYLQESLGYENITFYLVPTGRVQAEAAANVGLNPQEIGVMNEAVTIIRDAQSEIALEREDVQLAPDYSDLNMIYEEGQFYGESYDQSEDQWSRDFWHLGHDGLKVNGDRLAQYIALDRGYNNVISFTDSFGNPAQSISLTRAGILDLNFAASSSPETIQGTINPDLIVGSASVDTILGGNGNDVIFGGLGSDTLTGGNGNDVFFYQDVTTQDDRITDFTLGSDRIDLSEPLILAGYDGSNPIADGYVLISAPNANSVAIKFDPDGVGEQAPSTIAILENTNLAEFQNNLGDQFIFTPTEF